MAIKARILTAQDIPKIQALLEEQPTMFGESNPYSVIERLNFITISIKDSGCRQYVAEDESGNLHSFARQIFIPASFVWVFAGLVVHRSRSLFSPNQNGVASIMNQAILEAENLGYYSYMFVTRMGLKTHGFRRMQRAIPILMRYDYYDEAIIKAGQKTTMEKYSRLVANKTYSHDLLVRVGMLKNEFRRQEKIYAK